jgi:flap endonuclease-1
MGVAIRDILTGYRVTAEDGDLRGIAAIDAHNALYQFLSIIRQPDGTPLMNRDGKVTSHLSGLFFRTVNLLEKGVRPVYVFDGKPPEFKAGTVERRREKREIAGKRWAEAIERGDAEEAYRQARASSRIDNEIIGSAKKLLDCLGIPVVDAPSEGEAQCSCMAAQGQARYACSQDYDSLLFGTPVLVRNLTVSGKRKVRGRTVSVNPEIIHLEEVLTGLALDREGLIELGILVGTDFNGGVRGVGPKKALKIVSEGRFEEVIDEELPGFNPDHLKKFFLDPPCIAIPELDWHPPERDAIIAMLCEEYDFARERLDPALERIGAGGNQRTLDAWF